uniref:Uncharacterized protein n=1 Tax=Lepeophtheirus salmonis TaxID=72036 RepID=A0A0K2T3U9_LEPSM
MSIISSIFKWPPCVSFKTIKTIFCFLSTEEVLRRMMTLT